MISAKKAFHSQSETRANYDSTISMINEIKAVKSFVSSVATMPTTIIRTIEESHTQGVSLLKDRISVRQERNRTKVLAIVDYIERMQNLDEFVSSVINSPISNGDVEGTIAVFSQALQEANDKIAFLSQLQGECEYYQSEILKLKQEIKMDNHKSLAFDVALDQERLQKVFMNRHAQEKKLK